jgi:hypothetical protein
LIRNVPSLFTRYQELWGSFYINKPTNKQPNAPASPGNLSDLLPGNDPSPQGNAGGNGNLLGDQLDLAFHLAE